MILTEEQRQASETQWNGLPQPIRIQIRQASVKLMPENLTFTGSGVIFSRGRTAVTIATARHNLWKAAGLPGPPGWDSQARRDLETQFLANVRVWYNEPLQPAPLTRIIYLPADSGWEYDAMLLTSDDGNLSAYATGCAMLQGAAALQPTINFVQFRTAFNQRENVYIQTGYGQQVVNQATSGGPWQFRTTTLQSAGPETVLQSDAEVYHSVVRLMANPTTTTAPGDSGGPLFAYHQNSHTLYLLGVTLGENYTPEAILPDDAPTQNNASTLLTPILLSQLGQ